MTKLCTETPCPGHWIPSPIEWADEEAPIGCDDLAPEDERASWLALR